jgi:hypothetical protein
MKVLKVENGWLEVADKLQVNAQFVAGLTQAEYLKSNQRGSYEALFGKESTDARMTEAHAACVAAYPKAEVKAEAAEKAKKN